MPRTVPRTTSISWGPWPEARFSRRIVAALRSHHRESVGSRAVRRLLPIILLALLVAPAAAHATWPGGNGMIAVRCAGICTMNPDGSGARMLPGGEGTPSFSPDGNWIVHTRSEPDAFPFTDLWVMRSDGSDARRLTTEHGYDDEPSWPPDATRIVFHSTRDLARTSIWSMAADGSDVRPIVTGDMYDSWPTYNRDGSRLLVARGVYSVPSWGFTPSAHILSLAPDGSDPRPLTEPGAGAGRPDVSPDGARVVISSGRNIVSCSHDSEQLFTFALDGSDQRAVFSPATASSELIQPVWSPDGRSILATTPPATRGGIFVLTAAGGAPVEITPGLPAGLFGWSQTYQASWQPCIAGVTRSCRSEPPASTGTGTGTGTATGTGTPYTSTPAGTPDNAGPVLQLPATNRSVLSTRAGLVRLRVGPFA